MPADPAIETLVIQPTPFCNIACTYCYLPHRSDRSVMSTETLRTVFERVFASRGLAPALTRDLACRRTAGAAGRVLPRCVRRHRAACDRRTCALRHAIQTNGMLITPEWCELFRQHHVGVGVSLDGPAPSA